MGHEKEDSLKILAKLLPSTIVLTRKDFSNREELLSLIHSIKRLYRMEKDVKDPYFAVDQEGGNVVRLPFINYNPSNAFLGNLNNPRFTEYVGARTGYDLKALGIDWDLAPVLDLASPYNQVILERSFSSDSIRVAAHGNAFIRGLQRYGVAATAKHFPGHGGVLGDSHQMLPKDERNLAALTADLYPFKGAVKERVASVMISHVLYSAMDDAYPASLSAHIYRILREDLGYTGLAITDSLNMKAISKNYSMKEIGQLASRAGADILECVEIENATEISMHLEMKDEHASARRISELLPEKESTIEPPSEVLNAFSILGNTVARAFSPLDPEERTAVVFLDDTRESLVSDSFTNSAGIVSRLKETGLKLDSFTSEDFRAGIKQYKQVVVIGRNEHLKERYKILNAELKAKRSVFISTGVPADVGLLSDEIGYISTYSTKIDTVLGAVLRAFGFY